MSVHTLTQLQYSEDKQGPWKLYVYNANSSYHSGGVWFRKGKLKYPDEEITFPIAKVKCANAMRNGREVRVCDGGDMLVFHARGADILYGKEFWEEAALAQLVEQLPRKEKVEGSSPSGGSKD